MLKALVVYASLTGNTEEIADILVGELETLGVEASMEECTSIGPEEFEDCDICVVATYTYGTDGDLPDEIIDFYEELEETDLSGKVFGALGSGDTFYEKFCQSVIDFDAQFAKTGAKRGADMVFVDLRAEDDDLDNIRVFAEQLVDAAENL